MMLPLVGQRADSCVLRVSPVHKFELVVVPWGTVGYPAAWVLLHFAHDAFVLVAVVNPNRLGAICQLLDRGLGGDWAVARVCSVEGLWDVCVWSVDGEGAKRGS